MPSLVKEARRAADDCDCILYRVAQLESFLVYIFNKKKKTPFALEVVNDPSAWNMNFFVKMISCHYLKSMCIRANGVAYVTKEYLQKKYPQKSQNAFSASYSTVDIESKYIVPYQEYSVKQNFRLVHVANLIDGFDKGHDTVLSVIRCLVCDGYNTEIVFVGDGPGTDTFKQMAKEFGIDDHVFFTGRITNKDDYMNCLKESDAFIFPSHTEGLPRVIIEAMASGLPCIASPVGGTSELIDDWCLVDYNNVNGYVEAIKKLIHDTDLYNKTRKRNIEKSKEFAREVLTAKRNLFYQELNNSVKEK